MNDPNLVGSIGSLFFLGVALLLGLIITVSMWIVLTKAGLPGWGVLIPIFNIYCLLKVAGMSGWWLIVLCIPLVSLIPGVMMAFNTATHFGRGAAFGLGLLFLPFIFYPILAFGDDQWSE
jgi:hypothetical protein